MKKRYPPIPKVMRCPGGDVAVTLGSKEAMLKVSDPGEEVFGFYNEADRFILIRKSLTAEQKWRVFYHEWVHVLLEDSGLTHSLTADGKQEEAICDAVAAARMRERFG